MRKHSTISLRKVLSRGLIAIQAVVLVGFTVLAILPVMLTVSEQQGLDDSVIDDIVKSVARTETGSFALSETKGLRTIQLDYPDLWFVVVDAAGHVLSQGNTPLQARLFPQNLVHFSSANFANSDDAVMPYAIVRTRDTADGRLWVMTGGGPLMGMRIIGHVLANPFFLGLLLLLATTTLVVIPPLIKRSLVGLERVAQEAAIVDVSKTDIRLSYDGVPTELVPLVRAFNGTLDRLDGGIARQQRFMADAAHELRTPIAILQTRLESLPDGPEKRQLQRDTARLAGMANELLDLQRMAQSPDSFQPVDLVEMAAQVTADLAPLAIDAGNDIEFVGPPAPVLVQGDTSALSRAVANLVHNAMAHGGPKVAIRVEVTKNGSIAVSDNGPGVAPDHREEIFWPFHRLSQSPNGAGLGLSLVSDIVTRHGGRISVGTAPQGGALFEISLPLAA
ncbi:Signal transduction histidine kinase [Devosia crocina]|uniref:histidine kinase n=1 Tax=Devosia crocina TaxID=429728 RepID=A0A1I7N1V0_9HYPH|nr:HAMP domain-containing sensor histidine kinase [Devosia crocina]SFV28630.1 Signal transduction histidine kinase [Devosia crocina]